MSKKGFTLVELLAVIAILAILVIIALPNVLKMFNDSKKNAFIVQARKTANVSQGKLFLYLHCVLQQNYLHQMKQHLIVMNY